MTGKRKKLISASSLVLLLIYLAILVYFTMFWDRLGRTDGFDTIRYNLVPFEEIKRFINYRNVSFSMFLMNVVGNIVVFVPMGFLLPLLGSKGRFFPTFFASFGISLCIECIQLITKVGVFDVDDLILNTIGGIIGFILCFIVHRILRRKRRKKRAQEKGGKRT